MSECLRCTMSGVADVAELWFVETRKQRVNAEQTVAREADLVSFDGGFNRFSDGVSRDVLFGKSAAAGSMDTLGLTAVAREQRGTVRSVEYAGGRIVAK